MRETATWCRFSYRGWYRRFWAPSSALSKWGSYQCHVHEITCSAKVYDRHQDHCAKTPCHRSWLACSACVVELWYRANPLRNWQGYCAEVPNAAPESLTMLGSLNAPLSEVVHQSSRKWYVRDPLQSPALPIQSPPRESEAFTENVKRAHLQTCIWKAAMLLDPPTHVWLSQAWTIKVLATSHHTSWLGSGCFLPCNNSSEAKLSHHISSSMRNLVLKCHRLSWFIFVLICENTSQVKSPHSGQDAPFQGDRNKIVFFLFLVLFVSIIWKKYMKYLL